LHAKHVTDGPGRRSLTVARTVTVTVTCQWKCAQSVPVPGTLANAPSEPELSQCGGRDPGRPAGAVMESKSVTVGWSLARCR
jgi:hypothetical protein